MKCELLLQKFLRVSLSLCVSLLFWPIILISLIFLFIIRICIQQLLNTIYGNGKYTLTNSFDAIFAYDKVSGGCQVPQGLLVVKGCPDLKKIRQRYLDNVFAPVGKTTESRPTDTELSAQRLTKTFVSKFGFTAWKDTSSSFNLNQHVRYVDGITIKDKITEEQMFSIISKLLDDCPLNEKIRPQWEHLIIPNYLVEGSKDPHYIIIFRMHHAYTDGVSFSMFANSVFSDMTIKLPIDPLKPMPGNNSFKEILLQINASLFGPLDFIKMLKKIRGDKSSLAIQGNYSNKKHLRWSNPIEMRLLKEIRSVSKTSLVSILLTGFTGAVKKLYEKRSLDFGSEIPAEINISSIAALLPYKNKQLQNHFTIFNLPCPLNEPDGAKRLMETDVVAKRISFSSEPTFNFFTLQLLGHSPRIFNDLFYSLIGLGTVMYSNVFGSTTPFKVFGGEVTDAGAWLPFIKTNGLGLTMYSYCDKMRYCIGTDSKLFASQEDLKCFMDDVESELRSLGCSFGVES